VAVVGRASVDIGVSADLELVDRFCCLGDMLGVDGDAGAAEGARVQVGQSGFGRLVPLLTNRISLMVRERLCSSSMQHCMEVRPGLQEKKIRWHFSGQR